MAKLTKAQIKSYTAGICEVLEQYGYSGANPTNCVVQTRYGALNVKIDTAPFEVPTVFTRFEEPERAREGANCNPYTGKWNFHVWAHQAEFLPGMVEAALWRIAPDN